MIPLLDMVIDCRHHTSAWLGSSLALANSPCPPPIPQANHINSCPHVIKTDKKGVINFIAGAPVKKGEEVRGVIWDQADHDG